MSFLVTFFLNAGGLFDFDLTLPAETTLFILLALVVTNVFINPLSKELKERAKFINTNIRKSNLLVASGYQKLTKCVGLLTKEITEMNRQIKMTKAYCNSNFEDEVLFVQEENSKILSELKGDLSVQSALLFSNLTNDLFALTDKFFVKKFQSVS